MLSNQWTIAGFCPMHWLPNGVRLTAYSGEAADLPAPVLQDFLDAVAGGEAAVPLQIGEAHTRAAVDVNRRAAIGNHPRPSSPGIQLR